MESKLDEKLIDQLCTNGQGQQCRIQMAVSDLWNLSDVDSGVNVAKSLLMDGETEHTFNNFMCDTNLEGVFDMPEGKDDVQRDLKRQEK